MKSDLLVQGGVFLKGHEIVISKKRYSFNNHRRIVMNRIPLIFHTFKTVFVVMVFLVLGSNVYAGDKGCWAEFFDGSQYTGKHFLLEGPAQLKDLNNVNGENWNLRIDSIKVGPKAKVTVFENPDFKMTLKEMAKYPELMHSLGITENDIREDSELIFNADSKVHDLSDFNFHKKIKSLKIECI